MAAVTKRCAVCETPVDSAMIFCGVECQDIARALRNAQPHGDEEHTLASVPPPDEETTVVDRLREVAGRHRSDVAVIVAAYLHKQLELDSLIWAAHSQGLDDRTIGVALDMRTASVRRRIGAFQARMYGPVGGSSRAAVAG